MQITDLPPLITDAHLKANGSDATAEQRQSCNKGARRVYLFMAALSLATAASTSVMMLPGPMAFTRTL